MSFLFYDRYKKLNRLQRQAVNFIDGPLLVLAGPGTGKTEVLSLRASNILRKTDTFPESVLCLTYTDSGAINMKERMIELIGEDAYKVPIYTFHSFCKKIIEDYTEYFYKGVGFNLAEDVFRVQIIEDILKEMGTDNPLCSIHPGKGFVYLKDIGEAITDIKEAGFTCEEFEKEVKKATEILQKIKYFPEEVFKERVNKSTLQKGLSLVSRLRKVKQGESYGRLHSINSIIASSLERALSLESTTKISEWKRKEIVTQEKKKIFKDFTRIGKMKSLADICKKYHQKMYKKGYYDFTDMILEVIKEGEKNETLQSEIQEKYQYILVDEFQDTSGVQMRFLDNFFGSDPDKKPNICVVADDDQAIYKFQGAEVSNILNFKKKYPRTKVITLRKNYRSDKKIIKTARKIIEKGEERIENYLPEVKKEQQSETKKEGKVFLKSFSSEEEEFFYVVQKIKEKIKKIPPEEIAVIARRHEDLKKALPFFNAFNIPVYAQRKEDVMEKDVVRQIISILKFSQFFLEGKIDKADSLLPEILSYSFWNINREDVWKVARDSFEKKNPWLLCMKDYKSLAPIAVFLNDLSLQSREKQAEEVIDIIIGTKKSVFQSPFKDYYFSEESFKKNPGRYINFLSSLKCFITSIKNHKIGKKVKVSDVVRFAETLEENELPLLDKNPLVSNERSVSLITAHGAKGREFSLVFVLGCSQENWAKAKKRKKLSFFSNMPFAKPGEEKDDHLRLFYVAATRAKKELFFTFHKKGSEGREKIPLEFLGVLKKEEEKVKIDERKFPSLSGEESSAFCFLREEKEFLLPIIADYKMSATGLTKFLNITDKGPQSFFEENILRFPMKKNFFLSYGTAVHNTIAETSLFFKKKKKLFTEKQFLHVFKEELKKERMSDTDLQRAIKKGEKELSLYYKKRKKFFKEEQEIEKNFYNEDCQVEGVKITGKIDKVVKKGKEIEVTDFKTGKSFKNWKGKGDYEKIKAWKYKMQIVFYKILLESAKSYQGSCKIRRGFLEFVEPNSSGEFVILSLEIEEEDVFRLKKLLNVVSRRVKNFDFSFPKELRKQGIKGIKKFEEKLLSENSL